MSTTTGVCQAWGPSAHLAKAAAEEESAWASKNSVLIGLSQALQAVALLGQASKIEEKLEIDFALPLRCFIVTLPLFAAAVDITVETPSQASPKLKKRVQWLHTHIGSLYQAGSIATSLFLLYLGCKSYAVTALANLVITYLIKKEFFPSWLCEGYRTFSYLLMVISDFTYGRTLFLVPIGIDIIRLCLLIVSTQAKPKEDQDRLGSALKRFFLTGY